MKLNKGRSAVGYGGYGYETVCILGYKSRTKLVTYQEGFSVSGIRQGKRLR